MIKVTDIYGESKESFDVDTNETWQGVEICLGDRYDHPTAGAPIFLENRRGVPVLCVWANPESEDPSHIIEISVRR